MNPTGAAMSEVQTPFHFDDNRPCFENLGQKNGATHWREADLREALGYQNAASFRNAICRAMQACLSAKILCEDNFILKDGEYLLNRFACYLVAINSDPKKPEVAAAQSYFATVAEALETYFAAVEGVDRLLIRDKITDGEKSLSSTAHTHGVENYQFFQNAGYRGMYNMNISDIKTLKRVGDKESLLDRMGKDESAAHLFRITQTDAKINNENIRGQKPLEQAAFAVGKKVRGIMQEISGSTPESLPAAEPIKDVKKQIKEANKQLKKLDGPPKKPPK
jgi:DNA-damage-inducible protein D